MGVSHLYFKIVSTLTPDTFIAAHQTLDQSAQHKEEHLQEVAIKEEVAHEGDDTAAGVKYVSHPGVHNAIQISLPVPCLLPVNHLLVCCKLPRSSPWCVRMLPSYTTM